MNHGVDDRFRAPAFTGTSGPITSAYAATPATHDGGDDDIWPRDAAGGLMRTFVDNVLPAFVDDADIGDPLPFGGAEQLAISDVGISGTSGPVTWRVSQLDEEFVTVTIDSSFDHEDIHRSYRFRSTGTATGEFRVNRTNVMDVVGRIDVEFVVSDDDGEQGDLHQWWEATAAATSPEGWRLGSTASSASRTSAARHPATWTPFAPSSATGAPRGPGSSTSRRTGRKPTARPRPPPSHPSSTWTVATPRTASGSR
jgi:hypothetical protein